MKKVILLFLLILCFPFFVFAGEIYGNINPSESEIEVQVTCSGRTQNAYTDSYGSYRLYVPQSGNCSLKVFYKNKWTRETRVDLDHPLKAGQVCIGQVL